MLHALLIISVAAAPPVALVERANDRAPAGAVQNLERRLRVALAAANVPVADERVPCGEEKDCLFVHASRTRSIAVALSAVMGRKGVLVDLQATSHEGLDVAAATFILPAGDKAAPEVNTFVQKVATAWNALPEEKVTEPPPPPPVAEPEVRLTEATTNIEPLPERSHAFRHVTLGTSIVTGAASIALGVIGAVVKASLDSSLAMQPPTLTRPMALEQAGTANGLFTASLISGIVAGVAAVITVILFVTGN